MEHKLKVLKDIQENANKEVDTHINNFGVGDNRDIDGREKFTLKMYPNVIFKRIKEEAIKWIKEDIKTDGIKSTATLLWMKRLSIKHEELLK